MHRPTSSAYAHKTWTVGPSHSVSTQPSDRWSVSTAPGPMPSAPHLHTVSLPHPNSAPRYSSSPSGSPYAFSSTSSSHILALNPLLSYTGSAPVYFNVARDIQYLQFPPTLPQTLLYEPAVNPASTLLVLNLPGLPLWSTIEVRNPRGVSAYDVLVRIRDVLDRSVSPAEMGAVGVKRIDFLGPNVFFAGLSRTRDGQDRWEVHFQPRV